MNLKMASIPEDEFHAMYDYLSQVIMREGSTEYSLAICFDQALYAYNPLEAAGRLGNPDLPFAISFFYGDIDWQDNCGGLRTLKQNKLRDSISKLHLVENSNHHMYFDNPQQFQAFIIEDIELSEEFYKFHTGERDSRLAHELQEEPVQEQHQENEAEETKNNL